MATEKNPFASKASRIFILPSLFTAGNLFFGFLAIIRCIQAKYGTDNGLLTVEYYKQAVWFILFAFICDALDGRIARMGSKESLFGKEFDSLADIVSFGIAPSLMMFFLILSPSEGFPFIRQVGWLIGFIYLLCAAVRLARFNVLTHPLLPEEERWTNKEIFVGLPVPASAACIASLVLIMVDINSRVIWLCMPGLMLLIAFLMVSNVSYPSFKNIDSQTQIPALTFLGIVALVVVLILFKEVAFSLIFLGYIFYGLFKHLSKSKFPRQKKDVNKM